MNENLKKQSHEKLAPLYDYNYKSYTVEKFTEISELNIN